MQRLLFRGPAGLRRCWRSLRPRHARGSAQSAHVVRVVEIGSSERKFTVAGQEFGHSGRPLPTWACSGPGSVQWDPEPRAATELRDLSHVVPGCFQLLNVLSRSECEQMCKITEGLGYDEDAPVSLPHSVRHMENVNWIVDPSIDETIWLRAREVLPEYAQQVAPGADAVGVNARFRCYRYQQGDYFKPHTDGSWPGSRAVNGRILYDAFGDRWSQFTFLILLTDGYEGGRTLFYNVPRPTEPDGLDDVEQIDEDTVAVRTPIGGVLCFPHGGHRDHSVHAGERVESGCKMMVRSEILYRRTPQSDKIQAGWVPS